VGCREDVPVWHEATARWVREGKLVVLGVAQEQHPDRCRLFAQWKGFDWPILHDPIDILELYGVPELVAIDEYGIVRSGGPKLERFEADFLNKRFADDAGPAPDAPLTPSLVPGTGQPNFDALTRQARAKPSAAAWRQLGDALALWGGLDKVDAAIAAYGQAVRHEPGDGAAWFRLGVCYRRRYDSPQRQSDDFQTAVESWGKALPLDPNWYIWRRRIQQYGPRLDKPYAFYDWVEEAEKDIRRRGEQPVALPVRPGGAEIAQPLKALPKPARILDAPDPTGKVERDRQGWVQAEVTVVPARVRPGQPARVHVVLRLDPKQKAHWNNEAGPLRFWIDPPPGWQVAERLLTASPGSGAVSAEDRALDFEVKVPTAASGQMQLSAYACYYACESAQGKCRFLRLDVPVTIHLAQ
jgi:tetratricopeptide (TPR) repeat protein